jgi:hypothetical protein
MDNRTSSTNLETPSSASGHRLMAAYPGKVQTSTQVLNPSQPAYKAAEAAWAKGKLNPHEGDAVGKYFNLGMAYSNSCHYGSDYYTVRDGRYVRRS